MQIGKATSLSVAFARPRGRAKELTSSQDGVGGVTLDGSHGTVDGPRSSTGADCGDMAIDAPSLTPGACTAPGNSQRIIDTGLTRGVSTSLPVPYGELRTGRPSGCVRGVGCA